MKRIKIGFALALLFAALFLRVASLTVASAQQAAGAGANSALPQQPQAVSFPVSSPTLADFAWLEGRWRGEWGPRVAEQVWMAPKAGTMAGLFRLVENDKLLVIEMFTLVEKPDEINFYFRHFTPSLLPWEKSDAIVLKLANLDAKRADFENPLNGMPKRAILTRVDPDTYVARSEIIPDQGDAQIIEITYHRQKSASEQPNPSVKH
jgi:Domain of unknown function (DUF6265)